MELQDEFISKSRAAGATEWMLDHLCLSILEKEPVCLVIGADFRHCQQMRERLHSKLIKSGLRSQILDGFNKLVTEDSKVFFISCHDLEKTRGMKTWGLYIDHFVLDQGILKKDDLINLYLTQC